METCLYNWSRARKRKYPAIDLLIICTYCIIYAPLEESAVFALDNGIPEFLLLAAEAFERSGARLYLVGGWLRNRLLGLPHADLDVSAALPPAEAMAVFQTIPGVRIAQRDTALGTFGILCGEEEAEYTAFRAESYGEGGAHRPREVRFGVTIAEDALRRDFTVNALYHDIAARSDVDPLGGLRDLEARRLRTCRKPGETFADDGLRLMRTVRFACELGFDIETETYQAVKQHAALLRDIAPERLQAEFNRILLADARYPELKREENPALSGLHLLDETGLLRQFAPEFEACRGVEQRPDYHDSDVLEHLFRTAACAPARLNLRLAALLHDIGKPAAIEASGRMVGHDKLGEGIARGLLTRLRYPVASVDEIAALIRHHMADLDGRTGESRLRLFFVKLGRERSLELAELRRADVCGSRKEQAPGDPAEKWVSLLRRMDDEHVPWTMKELKADGAALAKLAGGPSPAVGKLKRALHEHAVLHPGDNDAGSLMRLAERLIRDRNRFKPR